MKKRVVVMIHGLLWLTVEEHTREELLLDDDATGEATTVSIPPKNFPPMKTNGTACWCLDPLLPVRRWSRIRMGPPETSQSSSTIVKPTPRPKGSCFTTWHMQQPLMVNTTIALPETNVFTFSYTVSKSSAACCSPLLPPLYLFRRLHRMLQSLMRNEDEDTKEELYSLMTVSEISEGELKGLGTAVIDEEE